MHDATAVMFQPGTTLYNVYRPLLLGDEYGPWFVQMLLTKWRKGQKDEKVLPGICPPRCLPSHPPMCSMHLHTA